MNVISLQFLCLAAVSSILIWILPKMFRPWLIGISSIAFFMMLSEPIHWIYALCLVAYTWILGYLLVKRHEKWMLMIAIAVPVAGLCFYKYQGYFSGVSLIAPLGLSFYTFKAISYLVDLYQGKIESQSPLYVFNYLTFFPTFEAGPITRPKLFFEQLKQPFHFDYQDQKNGAFQCACGIFEKLVIADELGYISSRLLNSDLSGWYLTFGLILYAFNLYADFDAYSNIAIGLARMMGFHLPANFHTPYLASSLQEFWHRWHISLSTWLKDYIYIPLGGSRKGTVRTYLNLMIVFLVSGLWHGSTLMFALWGLLHGIIMAIEAMLRKNIASKLWMKYLKIPGIILNFAIVTALWAFFRSTDWNSAVALLASVFEPCSVNLTDAGLTLNESVWLLVLLGIMVVTDLLRNHYDMIEQIAEGPWVIRWLLYAVMIVVFLVFANYGTAYNPSDFIYITF